MIWKTLLLEKQLAAARELNYAVKVFSEGIDYKVVIFKIKKQGADPDNADKALPWEACGRVASSDINKADLSNILLPAPRHEQRPVYAG